MLRNIPNIVFNLKLPGTRPEWQHIGNHSCLGIHTQYLTHPGFATTMFFSNLALNSHNVNIPLITCFPVLPCFYMGPSNTLLHDIVLRKGDYNFLVVMYKPAYIVHLLPSMAALNNKDKTKIDLLNNLVTFFTILQYCIAISNQFI